MMLGKLGRIITFYSYKGGSGRTMAVSNVAWILASNGCRVLLIDWDVEAPGLHRFLGPFLEDKELSRTPGLMDFIWDATRAGAAHRSPDGAKPSLQDYVVPVDFKFRAGGSISFLPAGRQDADYARRVNTFDWPAFFERSGGGKLLEAMRDDLRRTYDYVLIDSRTGVSDTSGICTVLMPDMLAVLFTLNRQSMDGAKAVATAVSDQRGSGFRIFPIPARIENAELEKMDRGIAYARGLFEPFLLHVQLDPSVVSRSQQARYWNDVETPYSSFYAFEEVPAVFKEEPGSRRGLLAAYEGMARWMTDRAVSELHAPQDEELRRKVVRSYALTGGPEKVEGTADGPHSILRSAVAILRRQVSRHRWQYAALAFAVLGVLFLVPLMRQQQQGMRAALATLDRTNAELESVRSNLEKATREDFYARKSDAMTALEAADKSLTDARERLGSGPVRKTEQ